MSLVSRGEVYRADMPVALSRFVGMESKLFGKTFAVLTRYKGITEVIQNQTGLRRKT
jgi:hypothetical protein